MNIQSSIRHHPKVQRALASGTVKQPSVIIRTPSHHRDLLLTQAVDSNPSLREILLPIKDLAASAIANLAPKYAEMVDGVSVLIDLTVDLSDAFQESNVSSLNPTDATEQVSKVLTGTRGITDSAGQALPWNQYKRNDQPEGTVSVLAKVQNENVFETIEPIQVVLDQVPVLGSLFQLSNGILQMLDSKSPTHTFKNSAFDPVLMEELRRRLEAPNDDAGDS